MRAKREDLFSSILSRGARADESSGARIDYSSALKGLVRSILMIYLIGLAIVVLVDIVYVKTGNKSLTLFLTDLLLYNAAAVVLGMVVYQVTRRGWSKAYASESALLSITEVSADAVYLVGADSIIKAWSKGAERIFGFTEKEALGESVAIVLPDDFLERDSSILEPLLAEGIVTGHRTLSKRKDGEVFPAEASLSLLEAPDGEPGGMLIVLRDITKQVELEVALNEARQDLEVRVEERTAELQQANALLEQEVSERRRAEIALSESEEHFRSLIENAIDLIVVVDHLGKFEYISPSVTPVFGYAPEELTGVSALDIAHPDDLPEISGALARAVSGSGVTQTAEFRFRRKDGEYRMLEGIGTSFLDELGNLRVIINARDITERKRSEERISALNRELEARVSELGDLNRELEAFSYSVSHDLRAPVRAIKGFSSMIADNHAAELTPASARLLEVVIRNADQMDELIDGLLSFSRLGRLEMRSVEVDMRALAQTVFDELQEGSGGGATLLLGDLPPATGDPVLLRQVFANLIGNAIKFSSRASEPLIEIASSTDTAMNEYQVKDNGVGFNMDYADRLFGVFQRLHSSDDFEGTGIGLANVQRIVHRHGGTARAEGSPGEGATFYFTLPSAS